MRAAYKTLFLFWIAGTHAQAARSGKGKDLPKETLAHRLGLEKDSETEEYSAANALPPAPPPQLDMQVYKTPPPPVPDQPVLPHAPSPGEPVRFFKASPAPLHEEPLQKSSGFAGPDIVVGHPDDGGFFHFTHSLLAPNLSLGMGYVSSHWNAIHSSLHNHSWAVVVGASKEYQNWIEGGISYMNYTGSDGSSANDNIYAHIMNVDAKWFVWPSRVRAYFGGSVSGGFFRAWNLKTDTTKAAIFAKRGEGWFGGVVPTLGARIAVLPYLAFDVSVNYSIFLPKTAFRVGGPGLFGSLYFTR